MQKTMSSQSLVGSPSPSREADAQNGGFGGSAVRRSPKAIKGAPGAAAEAKAEAGIAWHAIPTAAEVFAMAETSMVGLDDNEAKLRLDAYGFNEMSVGTKRTMLEKIWEQVANIIIAILVVSAVISGVYEVRARWRRIGFTDLGPQLAPVCRTARASPFRSTTPPPQEWEEFALILLVVVINVVVGVRGE